MYDRLRETRVRIRRGVAAALAEEHTPHEVAASFAFGVVVTTLPTAGTAFVVFLAAVYLSERVSKLALVASLAVFNPPVKFAIYGASFWVGQRLLGPVPGEPLTSPTLAAGTDILVRQLLGNVLLAGLLAIGGYLAVRWLVESYRRRDAGPVLT